MHKVIRVYVLVDAKDGVTLSMPQNAYVLGAFWNDEGVPTIHVLEYEQPQAYTERRFTLTGGHNGTLVPANVRHVGSLQPFYEGGSIYHVFELPTESKQDLHHRRERDRVHG